MSKKLKKIDIVSVCVDLIDVLLSDLNFLNHSLRTPKINANTTLK